MRMFCFFKQKTAYVMLRSLVGSEMCIRDSDTIKNPSRYRHHLERVRWDAVWIDEAHSATNRASLRSQVARVLAPNADALILTTATPHNGKSESFAELISLLDLSLIHI